MFLWCQRHILSFQMDTMSSCCNGNAPLPNVIVTRGGSMGGAPGARPPKIGKNMIFWRKIVIFHTKYPNNFRTSLRSAQFFKCAPLTLNAGSAPDIDHSLSFRHLISFHLLLYMASDYSCDIFKHFCHKYYH